MSSINNTLLILPNQLFDKKYLPDKKTISKIIIWEHPQYFTKYKYNKKKIILHRSSMLYYHNYLKKLGYDSEYISFDAKSPKLQNYIMFDPIDKIKVPGKPNIIESPNFLLTKLQYDKYRSKTDKFFFNAFYMWGKKVINVISNVKSQDKDNREPLTSDAPSLPKNTDDNKIIKLGIDYANSKFSNNYGNTDNFIFPVTHDTARKWLKDFISNRFDKFGNYQDAIIQDNSYLFHSVLSTSINIGLLNPLEIIEEIMKCCRKSIPINSFEGYIRQLFWREYQRYCYIYYNFNNKNYFGNNKKLDKKWYPGGPSHSVPPVDDCVEKAFNNGYLNHIERLMVVGNFMNLYGIHPMEGFKWFMEFSCDSYEWVMAQNVLDMVFFVSGGDTMRRPYSSSSNYILKMSNYKKGDWCDIWDDMYKKFIEKNKKKLWKFRYHFPSLKK